MATIHELKPGDRRVNRRLDSWKEIAAFFDRDERTVKRWEKERSLPVHRLPGGSRARVFAFTQELSVWMNSSALASGEDVPAELEPEGDAPVVVAEPAKLADSPQGAVGPDLVAPGWSRGLLTKVAVCLLVLGAAIAALVVYRRHVSEVRASEAVAAKNAHSGNPEAEQLYLKGRFYWNKRTPSDLTKAVDYFTQAIVNDPNYAAAYVGLADCYNLLREFAAMPETEAYPRALAAARKAVELDPSSAEAHASLAFVTFYWNWDIAGADREFRRAIELNPNYATAHHWYANYLMQIGRWQDALREISRAQQFDPSSTAILADKALILFGEGNYDEATSLLQQIQASQPGFFSTHRYLSYVYKERGTTLVTWPKR